MQLATSTSQQSSLYQRDIRLSGGAHAVLLIHGLASTPLELRIVAKALHKHDFTTVVPYFPGYGNDSACASWQDWLAGVRAQFLALQATHTTVSLGGLCIGATLALALAIEQPVQSLALLSTTLQYDGWAIPYYHPLLSLAYHTPIKNWYTYREREPFGLKNEKLREGIRRSMLASNQSRAGASTISIDHIYQAQQLAKYVRKNLSRITCDTLLMHAIDDETSSPKNAQIVYDGIHSVHKHKLMLDDCYHMITLDNGRDNVARETALFIKESVSRNTASHLPRIQQQG
ncbi:alpha/beta hydrolase [Ampullimonas aquatilis]|uniref:alpha/beta hydrolase n=1 Tax=Ampullimonas aquatilis TaxID=1341549 RepID=UPI003C789E58